MSIDETQKKLNEYFTEKLETFGATAKGVDYNGEQAQQIRFAELVKVINPAGKFSVTDYGSGYGAMFEFLNQRGWDFEYYGVDIIENCEVTGIRRDARGAVDAIETSRGLIRSRRIGSGSSCVAAKGRRPTRTPGCSSPPPSSISAGGRRPSARSSGWRAPPPRQSRRGSAATPRPCRSRRRPGRST